MIDQFENIAVINGWNDEDMVEGSYVCLTGRTVLAYKNFSVIAHASLNAILAFSSWRLEAIYILQSFNLIARKEQSHGQILVNKDCCG